MKTSDAGKTVTELRRAGRYAEAGMAVEKLLEGAEAHVELGRIAFYRDRWEIAAGHFRRATELDPFSEPAQAWRVAALSRQRRFAEAREAADAVLTGNPEAHLVRIARARVTVDETGDEQCLLDECETVLGFDPGHLEALESRIYALAETGRLDDSAAAAEESLERHPEAAELYVAWGATLTKAGRFTDAVERYDRALARQPENVEAHCRKIEALGDAYRLDEALDHAETSASQLPEASRLHLAWGIVLRRGQDFAGALEKFDRALALDPHRADHYRWRAFALVQLDRPADALTTLRTGLEACPGSIELLVEQAWRYRDSDDTDAAIAVAEEAASRAPADPAALWCLVKILREARRFSAAESAAVAAIRRCPRDPELHRELGWVFADQDRDEEALSCFRQAAELHPTSSYYAVNVTQALRWLYRYEEAREQLAATCARLPEDPSPVEQQALLSEDVGAIDEALSRYLEINRRWPRFTGAWIGRMRLLARRNRYAEAEQVARQAIELNPFAAELRTRRAALQQESGDEAAAIATLREACSAMPGSQTLALDLTWFLRLDGQYEQAREILWALPDNPGVLKRRIGLLRDVREHRQALAEATNAADRFPADFEFRRAIGNIRADLGEDEQALADFEAVLARHPTERSSLRGKVSCLRSLRRYDEAVRILLAEIERRPNYPEFRVELAWTYAWMERWEECIAVYEKAVEIDAHDGWVRLNHANALRLAGRHEDAEAALLAALDLLPDNARLMLEMGDLCDGQNRHEEALTWFDRGLARLPGSTWGLTAKSAALRSLGRFGEAERLLAPRLEDRKTGADVVIEWGWVLRDRGELARARQAFERALTLAVGRRGRADALHCLGWTAFSADDFEEAEKQFRAAIAENPLSNVAKIGLAWTLVHEEEPNGEEEAEHLCLDVLVDAPRRHLAHTCLGVLYAKQGNLPQAEYHLRRSIEIDPYGGSYVDLGALFAQMGRFEEAEALLLKALDRDWYDSQAHIELGALHLQRDLDGTDDPAEARRAARHFRQALVIEPTRGAAAIGLSLALVKSPGDLLAAERVLREALRRPECDQPRWQLLVALARLLIGRGDETQRRDLHLEALSTARQAIELAANQADPHYVAGVAAYKAGESGPQAQARPFYRRRALHHFRRCLHHDPEHIEARRAMALAEESLAITRSSLAGSATMIAVAGSLLVTLWLGFFLSDKVTTVVISTLTPILVSLVALGFVLPFLVRLKLPGGVEADLSASLNQVSSGPTGDESIGPGRLVGSSSESSATWSPLGTGPRGELPRLG
ncbi:tetratricopeptide repeat protein [Amycolatopsis kentuckyensis]|uniref:tetratricopeptide repeat protein n=1 Tax=Amycolatopsis kentuckyensis TaxID=218823 RepID=UPI000A398D1A|nr:tetratricopeptide repeat protein [Amycolatopsis kentuckyensis]